MQGHQRVQRPSEQTKHHVEECPRCGEDHGEVAFREIEEPIAGAGGEYAWWWLCDTTGAPVLAQLSWEEC